MEWTRDLRRETEWRDGFAWFPVAIETINFASRGVENDIYGFVPVNMKIKIEYEDEPDLFIPSDLFKK